MARDQGCTLSEPQRVVWSRTASTFARARANSARGRRLCCGVSGCDLHPNVSPRLLHEIPGRRFQLAAVEADIEQGAVIEVVDARELGAVGKISTEGVEKKCSENAPGFALSMSGVRWKAITRIARFYRSSR